MSTLAQAVHATPALFDAVRDPVKWFVHLVLGALAALIDGARGDVQGVLNQFLFATVDVSAGPGVIRPFTENPGLRRLNLALAVAADICVAAVVLATSLRSVVDGSIHARHNLRGFLPRLLVAVVLVHFSLPLMQMAIDLDNALSQVALSLGDQMHVDGLPWSPVIAASNTASIGATENLFHGLLALLVLVALVILVLAYVLRNALLGVLVVLAPAAALLTTVPETRAWARVWQRLFIVTVFMQPVQLVVLRVALVVGTEPGGVGLAQTLNAIATLFIMLKVPGAMNTAAHLESRAETMGKHVQKSLRKAALRHFVPHAPRRHA